MTGLTPDRDAAGTGAFSSGTGKFGGGFRSDLPREYNPARGYIATANDNTHPKDFKGRPVFYNTSTDVDVSRIARIRQLLDKQIAEKKPFTIEDMERIQQDAYSLRAERDAPLFKGWTGKTAEVEKARAMIAGWDRVLAKDSVPGAIYAVVHERRLDTRAVREKDPATKHDLIEQGPGRRSSGRQRLGTTGRSGGMAASASKLPHMFIDAQA